MTPPVLLTGDTGTGKEVMARAIHAESSRSAGPFIAINCGAIAESLLQSELFGHEKGAFTGATAARAGCFEQADGGTIFLDEFGELPPEAQIGLLRVLQEGVVRRVGGNRDTTVDVRVIAATNRDLKRLIQEGAFREDLYYRVAVFPCELPPLREREGDVELLAREFLQRFASYHDCEVYGFTKAALEALKKHSWPGNVRELSNTIERSVLLEDGVEVSLGSLPDEIVAGVEEDIGSGTARPATAKPDARGNYAGGASSVPQVSPANGQQESFAEMERRIILDALEKNDWNIPRTAEALELGRATIYRKIERFDLRRPQR